MPIKIEKGVKLSFSDSTLKAEGPKGKLSCLFPKTVKVNISAEEVTVQQGERRADEKVQGYRAMYGTARNLIFNMVKGVSEGFQRELTLVGVGYRAQVKGKNLELTLGYSHPVSFPLPDGVSAAVADQTKITLSGADNELLGRTAASIRKLRPPEPYKGKGVRYSDEHVKRKAGKSGAK